MNETSRVACSMFLDHSRVLFILVVFVTMASHRIMAYTLQNKRVLVTGAGRGIGRAVALICAEEGAKVAIVSRSLNELKETESLILKKNNCSIKDVGGDNGVLVMKCDVTNEEEVESTVSDIVSKWGGIDVLVNNAGASQPAKVPLHSIPSIDLKNLLDINVVAVHTVTSAVLRHSMLAVGSGQIVNISSRAGKVGIPTYSAYVTSKFALEGMTASLAKELEKDTGIYVNTLSPGMVNTRSFPKEDGRPGVRTAESIRHSFLTLLQSGKTGHYIHADELDMVLNSNDPDISKALKPIDEIKFTV